MISGAENIYPPNFVESIIVQRMTRDKSAVTSGMAVGEKSSGMLLVKESGKLL